MKGAFTIPAEIIVTERVLSFCVASGSEWAHAGVNVGRLSPRCCGGQGRVLGSDRNGSFATALAFNSEPSLPAPLFIGDPKFEPYSRKVEVGRLPSRVVALLGGVDALLGVLQAAFCFHIDAL